MAFNLPCRRDHQLCKETNKVIVEVCFVPGCTFCLLPFAAWRETPTAPGLCTCTYDYPCFSNQTSSQHGTLHQPHPCMWIPSTTRHILSLALICSAAPNLAENRKFITLKGTSWCKPVEKLKKGDLMFYFYSKCQYLLCSWVLTSFLLLCFS